MLDAIFSSYQRSRGAAHVALDGEARIDRLFQSGSAKAMMPRTHGGVPEIVYLNTSGGLTGGDDLEFRLSLAPGASAMASTQTAERAYASPGGSPAKVRVTFDVGEATSLCWLPQETILFDRSALDRVTEVHLGPRASYLGLETIVLGRAFMGEKVSHLQFRDARRIFDESARPLHAEQVALQGEMLDRLQGGAGLAGASVISTLVFVAPCAGTAVDAVRALLPTGSAQIAASGWGDRLIVRAMGDDTWNLRAELLPAIRYLTGGQVPRVWQL